MGIRIIASRFSVTRNLTCKGLPSGIQKIVVIKCSPCRKSGVHLQRMSALECVLLSPGRLRVISIGFIQRGVDYSNCVVHAHNLCWRRVFKKTVEECEIGRFWRTRKSNFFPNSKCFSVISVTLGCIVVGQLFNNVDFVVYFEEYCGHLDGESLVPTNNVARNINFWGEEFAQMIIMRRFRRAIVHLFLSCFSYSMQ